MQPGSGKVAAETRGRVAAQHASGSLPWIGVDDPSESQRLATITRSHTAGNCQLPVWWPREIHGSRTPAARVAKKMEAWRTCGTWMTVTFCVTQPWCRPTHWNSTSPMPKVGAERNALKTEVTHNVNDLDASPLEWRIGDVQNMAKVSTVTGSITLGVAVGPRQHIADQHLANSDVRTRSIVPGPADGICPPLRGFGSQPHQPHPPSARPHAPAGAMSR